MRLWGKLNIAEILFWQLYENIRMFRQSSQNIYSRVWHVVSPSPHAVSLCCFTGATQTAAQADTFQGEYKPTLLIPLSFLARNFKCLIHECCQSWTGLASADLMRTILLSWLHPSLSSSACCCISCMICFMRTIPWKAQVRLKLISSVSAVFESEYFWWGRLWDSPAQANPPIHTQIPPVVACPSCHNPSSQSWS